jgi:hypothetical protein
VRQGWRHPTGITLDAVATGGQHGSKLCRLGL